MEELEKLIEVEKIIKNGNSGFLKSLPRFLIKLIERIMHQDELNATYSNTRHLIGVPFVIEVLKDWNVKVDIKGNENIPSSGRFIFVANHPVGIIDTMALFCLIYQNFPEVKSLTNALLNHIPNFSPLILAINVFGKNSKETAANLNALYESNTQILTFPAGEVARRKKGIISDSDWQKSFITKAIQSKRDIIPVHISGRNSNLFYNIASFRKLLGIKTYVETFIIPHETMKQRNKTITLNVGKVIPYQTFTNEMTHVQWAQKVKEIVYSIPNGKP